MSAAEIRKLHLDNQRETIRQQYKFKCDLLALTRAGARVVYANQAEAANRIIANFMAGKVWVVLVAQPGVGKTGTILEVLRIIGEHPTPKWQAHVEDMLLITGMSDTEWKRTVADGTLPIFEKRIHHRQQFTCRARNAPAMSTMRNGLIITDECHVAAQEGQTIHKALLSAGLGTIDALKERNMRMLDVSATPEGVLHDLLRWREDTAVVVLEPDEKYKGFQSMKDEGRLLSSKDYDLEKPEDAHRLIKLLDDRYKDCPTKKYFAFRISSDTARGNIKNACLARGWDHENHDSKDRVEDIDDVMAEAPPRHKVFFVKGFWRASKRIVRKHVGGSYEAPTVRADDTSKSQGLTARFCSPLDWEGEQTNVNLRPLHFDDIDSIDRYLEWTRAGYDYNLAAYSAPRLRSDGEGNVKHPRTKAAAAGGESPIAADEDPAPAPAPSVTPPRQRAAHVGGRIDRSSYPRGYKEFASAAAAENYYAHVFGSSAGFGSKPHTCKDEGPDKGKFECSFSNVSARVCDLATVLSHVKKRGGNHWGGNLNKLDDDTFARIGTIKIGYTGDVPTFVLCVCSKTALPVGAFETP